MDNFETLDDQVSEDEIKQDEEEGKKEEKEEEKLDVIGRQSVQTGAVGQPNGQAKNATEAGKDQALLAQSVTNQQVAGTRSNAVRSEIQKILDRTGKFGKEPDNVNYTAMKEGLKRLETQLNETVTKDNMLVSWRDLKKTYIWIATAANQYVNSHKNAISPSGISRKKHARALLNLCRSDVTRLDYQIKKLDTIDQQSTWKQLLEKKPGNANGSTLSVKKLAEDNNTGRTVKNLVSVAGFKVMTKEQFEAISEQSIAQLPETYKNLGSLLDDYSEKLTLGAKGSMQENDDSRAILNQILTLTNQYVEDIKKHKAASTGDENPRLVRAMNMLQSQCYEILHPKRDVSATTPANRLHDPLSMRRKVNDEIELHDLLKDKTPKDKTLKADPPITAAVTGAPKQITPQPEAPKSEVPKEAPKVGNQSVPVQNGIVPMGAGMGRGLFSKVRHAVDFEALPENYKKLGTLIEEYRSLENSRQGGEVLKAKLEEISVLAKEYLLDSTIPKEKRQNTISAIRYNADVAINKINRGENVLPQKPVSLRSKNLLPLPPKPGAQKPLPPLPTKPVAQKPLPPLPSVPIEQLPPAPKKPLPSIPQEEQPKPVVQEQQGEQAEPVVQESEQTQSAEPVTQETQQTEENRQQAEENQQQQETNTAEGTQQQEEPQNEEQQQPPQQQAQTAEPSGPSMRKTFLDEMKLAARTGGRVINPGYQALIAQFEKLYTALGETVTEANQKESWKKLQEAYGLLAAMSGQYAKVHAYAPAGVGSVCRKHARMLLFMCKFDMQTLQAASSDPELAKKNMTWRQMLEQPAAAPEAQQSTTQDVTQTNHPKGDPARDFRNWELTLSNSEKGGLGGNSKYFNRVKAALEQTAKAMEQGFSQDSTDNMKKLSEAAVALQALQAACQEYTARNPRTQSGKIRKNIVLQIQKYAAQDAIGCQKAISDFIGLSPAEQAKENWMSVIRKARSVQLTVDDFSQLEKASGGQASEVFKIESQEGDSTVTKYFKKEDSLDVSAGADQENPLKHMALQAAFKQFPKLSKQDKKDLNQLLTLKIERDHPVFSEEAQEAYEFYLDYKKKHHVNVESLMAPLGIVNEGGNANMSRRNVATTRMAELLGLGDLVAKSQTVDVLDKATGQTVHGNLMDQAEGTDFDQIKHRLEEKKVKSGFIRDMMNLQVLDMLCGQVDRHGNNMFYKTDDEGNVTGVQGIDNDGSFGTNTDAVSSQYGQRKDARLFDVETGDMIIPYMDKQLADRIEALDSQMVRYVLSDLLKKEEIDAAIRRLEVTKKGIKKAKEKHSDRFLEKKDDWTMEGVGENLLNNYNQELNDSFYQRKTVKELYKDDPKMAQGIILLNEHGSIFKKLYSEERQKEIKEEREKFKEYLRWKHWANLNYFGRLMSWNKSL